MTICEILAVFFDRMANYFDGILIGIELWFLRRHLSGHGLAEGRNNMILKEKMTTRCNKLRWLERASKKPVQS
jgi:hypothetical protein